MARERGGVRARYARGKYNVLLAGTDEPASKTHRALSQAFGESSTVDAYDVINSKHAIGTEARNGPPGKYIRPFLH